MKQSQPNETKLSAWVSERAMESGVTESCIWRRLKKRPELFNSWQFRRVNARVVFASLKDGSQDALKGRVQV